MYFFQNYGSEKETLFHVIQIKGESFPSHFHRAYEVLLVLEGNLQVTIDGESHPLKKGEAAFIFSNQIHSFQAEPNTQIGVLIAAPEVIPDFHQTYQQQRPASNIIQDVGGTSWFSLTMGVYRVKALLYTLCDLLVQQTSFKPIADSEKSELLHQMISWMMSHYQRHCTLKQLAAELAYDYKYLSKVFKQGTGMGFNEYVNTLRILKAQELLADTDLSVQTIAHQCGYESIRSFHRNYQQITGTFPSEMRSSLKTKDFLH